MFQQAKENEVLIKSGLFGTSVSKSCLALPVIDNVERLSLKYTYEFSNTIHDGFLTKDQLFISCCLCCKVELKEDKDLLIRTFNWGSLWFERLSIKVREEFRSTLLDMSFLKVIKDLQVIQREVSQKLLSLFTECSQINLSINNFKRIPLNEYDLGDIIQFQAAEKAVKAILKNKISDGEFIDNSTAAIKHFQNL